MRRYLLSIKELLPAMPAFISEETLLTKAFSRVDAHRRERAARMKPGRGQAASLGAGLLLQLAVGEALRTAQDMPEERQCSADIRYRSLGDCLQSADIRHRSPEDKSSVQQGLCEMAYSMDQYSVSSLLARLDVMSFLPLRYRYGSSGKPYLQDYPFYFSLSHSGDYVFCVLSGQEVGADIQQHRKCDTRRLAERFFSKQEKAYLEQAWQRNCGGEDPFFYLWARKEAFGKLTGGGIGDTAGVNMLPGEEEIPEGRRLVWEEISGIQGYSIASCSYEK